MYTEETKEILRENALKVLNQLIFDKEEFKLLLHQRNDWDFELPEEMLKQFPDTLPLDIAGEVFDHIEYEDDVPILKMMFADQEYNKEIQPEDILAIVNIKTGQPIIINDFKPDENLEEISEVEDGIYYKPTTRERWLKEVQDEGIDYSSATRSIDCFLENNPNLFKN